METSPFKIISGKPHAHEGFQQATALARKLRTSVRGEVRFDEASRALYATDASNYRQVPIGLVIPRDAEDVEAAIAACREFEAPVLARGAGTSLAGQGCNVAVVIDFSKYMRSILSLDATAKMARVEPGIVLDRLREAAEVHHLTFGPDPATHSRCSLGGMIGNNSCGVHGLLAGKTVDNVHSLELLLYDGTRMNVGETGKDELAAIIAAGGRKGQIYAGLLHIRDTYADLIRRRFPRIPRRVSGYNLDELLPENGFHVGRALVGSEGTCATILSATLNLTDSPAFRRLVVLSFPTVFAAADAVPSVLHHQPTGLEGFDGMLIDFMLKKKLAVDDVQLLPPGKGFLLVELGAWSEEQAAAAVEAFVSAAGTLPGGPSIRTYTPEQAARVWHVRESALGATVFVPGEPEGWEGWEDAAVPPEQLGSYLRQIHSLMNRFGYRSPMYGHFGQGCVHLRINFDLESEAGILKYREFIEQAADIVLVHGGSLSGEHGDGQSRAALLPKMFGPELMQAFREFKALWDPENRMNPGKLVDPVAVYEPVENLRLGAGYKPQSPATHFHFPADDNSFSRATLRCVGVGACRKEDGGTMCPSYMVTREERHSTRGRAHLLWELLEGSVLKNGWKNEEVREALDLCLSCKACKSECPVSVDVASYKAEFLAHHYERRLHPLRDYLFGFMDRWAALASMAPGISPRIANVAMRAPLLGDAVKAIAGVAAERILPAFAARSYQSAMQGGPDRAGTKGERVVLWPDTWNNYFHPQGLSAAHKVLRSAGFEVETPRGHICCGRPLYDFGFLTEARRYLEKVLRRMAPQIDAGTAVVMLEPSCASVFRDELLNFFPGNERAERLSRQTYLLSEFLVRHAPDFRPPQLSGKKLLVHGHCHHKSLMKMNDELAILQATGAEIQLLDAGCCGMAGPFGFEKEKFAVSQALGERVLLPAVRNASADTLLVLDGFSCREQVAQNTKRRAVHIAEVICGDLK